MSLVNLEFKDELALVTLNRPDVYNAMSFGLISELRDRLGEVAGRRDVRAVMITGAGDKAFSVGGDLKELRDPTTFAKNRGSSLGLETFAMLDSLPVASVALINGFAFGGGLELAMACTFRIASPSATMGLREITLGLIPGYGGTQRLPRLIGQGRALELTLTGRIVSAVEAEEIGLITAVAETADLASEGAAFCKSFTGYSLVALDYARKTIQQGLDLTLEEGLRLEGEVALALHGTHDAQEGMEAFAQKRRPIFRDR